MSNEGPRAVVRPPKRHLRHRVSKHGRGDRAALGVVRVEVVFGCCALHHLRQLPTEVHRILDTHVEALSADRGMHVRRVAGQQHAPLAVRGRLTGHVGEPRDPRRTVDAVVGPVHADERVADITQRWFAADSELALGQDDADRLALIDIGDGVDAERILVEPPLRFLGRLDLGDQPAECRIPPGELDACRPADHAPAAIGADKVLSPERSTV